MSPLVGVVTMIAVAICLGAVVATTIVPLASVSSGPTATFDIVADASDDRIRLTHVGGEPLETDDLRLVVSVGGESLREQPPVPFFATHGFVSDPTGPINSAYASEWTIGTTGGFSIASTNRPSSIEPGDRVTVLVVLDGRLVADLETIAT